MAKGSYRPSRLLVLSALGDHEPKSYRQIAEATGLKGASAHGALYRCWKRGLILRTAKPIYEHERIFKGRGGVTQTTRPYHLYLLMPDGKDSVVIDGHRFVGFDRKYMDVRGGGKTSKAQRILNYIQENKDEAFFSKDIAEALKDYGVKVRDIMSNVRRFEEKGLVYVRGYKTDERQTPFKRGYLITWLDSKKAREKAIEQAVDRTNRALKGQAAGSPLMERVHRIRDIVIEHSKLRNLVSFTYLENKLDCTPYKAEHALSRALQLYPDMKELKLFANYRYYYHTSLSEEDAKAAVEMKENYIRVVKGRANRVGHNWEAVAEWFIDKFTTGAKFAAQNHRNGGMDPRRITLHLIKGVGGRRNSAEVDRVWEVTPSVFAPTITYILSCKWGLVRKRDVDDFLEVLKWSKNFGVNTPDGRELKQGVVGVFAASAFNPRETVQLKDGSTISLAQYTARRELQLLKAGDFNQKLREKGCPKTVSVQKICKRARDEEDVRETLDRIWKQPEKSDETLNELLQKNEDLYKFEKMLEEKKETP